MKKSCSKCGIEKPFNCFSNHPKTADYLQSQCRDCQNELASAHKKEKSEWLNTIKSVPCMDCKGVFPPICMDFHHRDPRQKEIALNQKKYSKDRLLKEIEKCDIICANCHRIRHYGSMA